MAECNGTTRPFLSQLLTVVLAGLTLNLPVWASSLDYRDLTGISPTPSSRIASGMSYTNKSYISRYLPSSSLSSLATLLRSERDRLHVTVNAAGIPNDRQIENFVNRNAGTLVASNLTATQLHAIYLRWQASGYVGDEASFDRFFNQPAAMRQAFVTAVQTNGVYVMLSQHVKLLLIASVDVNNVGEYIPEFAPRIQLANYHPRLRRVNKMPASDCAREDLIAAGAALIGGGLAAAPPPSPLNAIGIFLGLYSGTWILIRPVFCA